MRERLQGTRIALGALALLLTAGGVSLAALDSQGRDAHEDGGPAALSEVDPVAEGKTVNGNSYRISSFEGNRGQCLRLAVGDNPKMAEACGLARTLGYVTVDDLFAHERIVFGPVSRQVARVRIRAEGGQVVTARPTPTANGEGVYLASFPDSDGELSLHLAAEASDGRVLAEERTRFATRRRPLPE